MGEVAGVQLESRASLSRGTDGGPGPPDADLVREVRQGNAEAFEALVRRHIQAAHGLAMSVVGDPDEADDVCQDSFIMALKRIGQLREPGAFRSWLLSIVRNKALNARALRARRGGPGLSEVTLASESPLPDRGVEWGELQEEVLRATEGLTEMQRSVFLLHDFEGMDHGEIAEALRISRGSSRVHLHMARRVLKGWLGGQSPKDA